MKIHILPALALTVATLSVLPAKGQRSSRKAVHHTYSSTNLPTEPDAPQRKAYADQTVMPQQDEPHKVQTRSSFGRGHINTTYRQGIDVSHYQRNIDWHRLARNENVSYVYIKATEGNSLLDEYYRKNLEEAHKAGISVGSYHFYRPNIDWRQQLEFMKRIVKPEEQDLVPLIDIEKFSGTPATFINDLRQFIEAVTKHYGKKPLLYTYQNFYNKHFLNLFQEYHWMIACYGDVEPYLQDGRDYIMWQYSCSGRLSGIRGDVDRSCLMPNFDLKQLQM